MYCTLCGSKKVSKINSLSQPLRLYYSCDECHLIFTDPKHHLSREEEKNRYLVTSQQQDKSVHDHDLHEIIDPALKYITPEMKGLDYGCGPEPLLSEILTEKSFRCYNYDPLFDFGHPEEVYDYIFATECLENFFVPANDLHKIDELLKIGGYLFVTTAQTPKIENFDKWSYKDEPTHVSFYSKATFDYIAKKFNYNIVYNDEKRCVIFQKY
jgi:hypothetical protein